MVVGRDEYRSVGAGIFPFVAMLGYWLILAGIVLGILGTLNRDSSIRDVLDDLLGDEAFEGLLSPEGLEFLGVVVAIVGLIAGFRLGLRRRR